MIGNAGRIESYRTIFDAWRTTNVQEEAFVKGQSFSYEDYLEYGADGINYFLFDPTAFDGINLVIVPPSFSATAGPVFVEYFANPDTDADGTPLGVSNRRGTSSNVNQATLQLNPTINNIGSRFTGRLVPATGVNPVQGAGAVGSGLLPFELESSIPYIIKVTNTDGAGVFIQTDFTWLEIR